MQLSFWHLLHSQVRMLWLIMYHMVITSVCVVYTNRLHFFVVNCQFICSKRVVMQKIIAVDLIRFTWTSACEHSRKPRRLGRIRRTRWWCWLTPWSPPHHLTYVRNRRHYWKRLSKPGKMTFSPKFILLELITRLLKIWFWIFTKNNLFRRSNLSKGNLR